MRLLKWAGFVLGVIVALVIIAIGAMYFPGGAKLNNTYIVEAAQVTIPMDETAIERGQHLVDTIGLCAECHGDRMEGKLIFDDFFIGRIVATNLTSGKGGIGGRYSDADFVRAIRHGVGPDGRPLAYMPSHWFYRFGDADLGAMIAYIKSLPPVSNQLPELTVGPLGRAFVLLDDSLLAAQVIDHTAQRPPSPEPGIAEEYGEYLAFVCTTCHSDPAGRVKGWSKARFIFVMRTGAGNTIDPDEMPWRRIGKLTDQELEAMWMYLQASSTPLPE